MTVVAVAVAVAVVVEGAVVPALGVGPILLCRFHSPKVYQAFGQVVLLRDLCQSMRRYMRCFRGHRCNWSMPSC